MTISFLGGTASSSAASSAGPRSIADGRPLVASRLASRTAQSFQTQQQSRIKHTARERCSNIYFTYAPGMTSDGDYPNPLNIKCAFETSGGVIIPGARNGVRTATFDGQSGGYATFGPFPVELNVGDVFYSRVRQWHSAGDATTLAASAAIGDSSLSLTALPLVTTGGFFVSAPAYSTSNTQEFVTVTGITGSGPYTATLSAPLTKAHPSGRGFGMINPLNLWLYSDLGDSWANTSAHADVTYGGSYTGTLNPISAGTITASASAGDRQITLSKEFLGVQTLTVGAGGTQETVTVRGSSGIGTKISYLTAPLAFAHSSGEAVSTTIGLQQQGIAPVAITADNVVGTRKKSVFIAGDSIAEEVGYTVPRRDASYASKACEDAGRAWIKTAVQSEGAVNYNSLVPLTTFGSGLGGLRRRQLKTLCDIFYYEYGTNDLTTQTLANLKIIVKAACSEAKAAGMKVVISTLTPRTTSTDLFATLTNQTKALAAGPEAVRTGYNDWLRTTKADGIADAIDDADLLLDSTQVGKWDPPAAGEMPRTVDGLHPVGGHVVRATYLQDLLATL